MIRPRSAAFFSGRCVGAGRDQDQLVEVRQGLIDLVAVDRPRVVRPFGDAARDQLRGRCAASPPRASAAGSSQNASRRTVATAETPHRGGTDTNGDLAVDRGRVAETDGQQPACLGLAGRRERRA